MQKGCMPCGDGREQTTPLSACRTPADGRTAGRAPQCPCGASNRSRCWCGGMHSAYKVPETGWDGVGRGERAGLGQCRCKAIGWEWWVHAYARWVYACALRRKRERERGSGDGGRLGSYPYHVLFLMLYTQNEFFTTSSLQSGRLCLFSRPDSTKISQLSASIVARCVNMGSGPPCRGKVDT